VKRRIHLGTRSKSWTMGRSFDGTLSWPRGFLLPTKHHSPRNQPRSCRASNAMKPEELPLRPRRPISSLSARSGPVSGHNVEVGRTLSGKAIGPDIYERSTRGSKHAASDFSSRKRSVVEVMPAVVKFKYDYSFFIFVYENQLFFLQERLSIER
jgi:hypothetical protein